MAQLWEAVQWAGGPETRETLMCQIASSLFRHSLETESNLPSPQTHKSWRNHRGLPAGRAQLWVAAFFSSS